MFHAAWPASITPPFRPTRVSGFGAAIATAPICAGLALDETFVEWAHAAADNSPVASDNFRTEVCDMVWVREGWITGRGARTRAARASSPYGRFRSSDRRSRRRRT